MRYYKTYIFILDSLTRGDINAIINSLVDGMIIDFDESNNRWYLGITASNNTDRDFLRLMLKERVYPTLDKLYIKYETKESII